MRTNRVVAEVAETLLDSLKTARRNCTEEITDQKTNRIYHAITRHDARQFAPLHITAILYDAFLRGAPEEDVQSFARELEAEIHWWFVKRDGVAPEPLPEVHCREEEAEGIAENTELQFVYDPSPRNFILLETAKTRHMIESQKLLETARLQAFKGLHS